MNRKKWNVSNEIDLNQQAIVLKMCVIFPTLRNLHSRVGAYSVQRGIHGLEDTPKVSGSGGAKKDELKDHLNKIRGKDKRRDYINNEFLMKS